MLFEKIGEMIMAIRVPWDCYEVALLFSTYERVADGADCSTEAARLSETLRALARRRGVSIDGTYRNVNGMKMQLANVQYLFTDGQKGLSGASAMIRQMYDLYKTNPADYQTVLKEAIRLTSSNASVEDAFFAYVKEENTSLSTEIRKRILSFVPECFPHGIRPASIIDISKLKRAYQTRFGEGLPADIDMVSLLTSVGLKSGEKVYFLSEDQKKSIRSLITDIIRSGHRVIYYSELFSLHGELFEACHIYESPLMQTVLQSILPEHIYKAERMLVDQKANEIEEITEVFGDDVILTYQQLKNRCPYLPMSVIKGALSRSDRFVWSSPETYAQVDLIELDQAEVSDIVNRILPLILEEGYFSLAQLPIEESCGLNPQVSSSAVRDAIYNRYMSSEFTRNGLIVKRPGIHLTTYQLMETWLKGLEQVTLTEVEDYERELTGHHAVLGIVAASSTMVRIDHDHYVSDASIQFNVDAVDHAISLFVGNRIIPITAITSYTSFPDVPGYSWNLYLVESFLRRFSKRFTIDGGPAQMSYVGGISSAERHFDSYEDRLAHAIIQDGVILTEEAIGRYLTDRKYILRRSETVRKTLDRARILNEQRGDPSVRI